MKKAVLTGGTGFLGYWLLHELVKNGVFVYVVMRKDSKMKERLNDFEGIKVIELNMDEIIQLPNVINEQCDVFYHLAWEGGRNDIEMQARNIGYSINAVRAAKSICCKRIIFTGSQAEYGIHTEKITENTLNEPNTAYGAAKLAACHLSRVMAEQIGIEWTWTRIFSLYGRYDHSNTLVSYLLRELSESRIPKITQAEQMWNYLHVTDAATALYELGVTDKTNTIYNLASEENKILKEYIIVMNCLTNPTIKPEFGSFVPELPIVNLDVSISKLLNDIKWRPKITFQDGIIDLLKDY